MTKRTSMEETDLGAFERVLETFGADRTRWPAPVRRNFAALLATSAEAEARLKEAQALDRLLDLAPLPEIDSGALAARIVAAAAADHPRGKGEPRAPTLFERRRMRPGAESQWPAAALLAASLVLGVFSGFLGTFDGAVQGAASETAFATDVDPAHIAFDSGSISMFEGDLL